MLSLLFQKEGGRVDRFGADFDAPAEAARNRRSAFVNLNPQSVAIP
jgi:hypothetical protein